MSLKISSVKISNVLGITQSEITPDGNIIEISGKNGSGKSSTVHAILDALGVSSEKTLLRNGTDKGTVEIDLGSMLVKKSYTHKGSTLTMKGQVVGTKSMANLPSPASVLKDLVAPSSINPVQLLTATNKELVDAVLESIPMTVDQNIVSGILGGEAVSYDPSEHALQTISNISKQISTDRRDINRENKTAKTTMEQLSATLPDEIPSEQDIKEQIEHNNEQIEKVSSLARSAKRKARQDAQAGLAESEREIGSLTDRLHEIQAELRDAQKAHQQLEKNCEKSEDEAFNKVMSDQEELVQCNVKLSEELSKIGAITQTVSQVNQYKKVVRETGIKSNTYTDQLNSLQEYKEKLCKDLPIKGLALTDGKLSMNGVPFSTLNTAARVSLVIELAKLSAGGLGLVVLDNAEFLDTETYKKFIKEAKNTDLQFIVAKVSDEDLTIK